MNSEPAQLCFMVVASYSLAVFIYAIPRFSSRLRCLVPQCILELVIVSGLLFTVGCSHVFVIWRIVRKNVMKHLAIMFLNLVISLPTATPTIRNSSVIEANFVSCVVDFFVNSDLRVLNLSIVADQQIPIILN